MKYLLLGVAVMLSLQAMASAFPIFDFEQFNHDMNWLTDSPAVNSAGNEHKTMVCVVMVSLTLNYNNGCGETSRCQYSKEWA
jgi:hypothetical protein